ncbi:MAG: J domain-containing protein [Desulfuromonadales bacterium]|nr:J domain-containing protein [Desulfuromonadales bacterium]
MPQVSEIEVFRACRTLFGTEIQLNQDFLVYLQPAGVRTAYRKKAKTTHPDCFAVATGATQTKQHRLFQDLNQAHQTVQSYLKQRKKFPSGHFSRSHTAYTQAKRRRQDHTVKQRRHSPLPMRPLQFGQFLYYQGIIPFNAMITAITWQRRQRPALGEIAKRWGWLNDSDIKTIINYRNGIKKFGERAEQLGLLTPLQVRTLLFHQRSRQKQLGQYFIEQGYVDERTLNQQLLKLAEHNRTFSKGFMGNYYYFHRS